jgi:hypothetical protein
MKMERGLGQRGAEGGGWGEKDTRERGGGATLHKTLPRLGMFFGKLWAFSLLPCSPPEVSRMQGHTHFHAGGGGGGFGEGGGMKKAAWVKFFDSFIVSVKLDNLICINI